MMQILSLQTTPRWRPTVSPLAVLGALALSAMLTSATHAAAVLVSDGEPQATIVLPEEPLEREQLAADELVAHLEVMTGATLEVVTGDEAPAALLPIHLGAAADEALDELSRAEVDNRSSFTLRVTDDRIDIRGLSDEGTLFGTYELLEQLGFRWYMPGELGRVVPDGTTARVEAQTTAQGPTMVYRRLQHIDTDQPWSRRARFGGESRSTGSHGINPFTGNSGRRLFESNPEYFAEIDGERQRRQICVSNPEVLELAVAHLRERLEADPDLEYVGLGPNDGGGYCECENCRALDRGVYDPVRNAISMTDRYIWFFNQMLDRLEDEHPDVHLVWYVYAAHMMPPEIEPNPRIVGVFAPIGLDRNRGMDNPMSPDRHVLRWLIDAWADTHPNEMYYRGYYNNLACVQLPFGQIDRIRHETPAFAERGINVMRVEAIRTSWSSAFLHLYVAGKMTWDADTNVDALLDEFYPKFYGPAEEPMRRYHEGIEAAFRDTPYFTGSSYVYLPIFLDHPRRERLRAHMDEATSAAEGIYADRVAAVRLNWDRLELFLDMIDARNHHDFATAHERMEAFDALTDEGVDTVLEEGPGRESRWPRLVNYSESPDRGRNSYMNRFFRDAVVEGHRRTVTEGELVTPLPDEWQFLIDPAEIGELAGYHRPGELGGNWQPLRTSSRSWSDQGLHYYKGAAWYRTDVEIPARFEGERVYLWFGGIDRVAHVWINGTFVGTSDEPAEGLPGVPGTFLPFDMPATDAVRFGQSNTVAVKIEPREGLAELGTGGIVAPVMFWSPNDPDWSPQP